MNVDIYNRWLEKTGHRLHEGYGQTELTLTEGNFPWMEPRPGSMGKPSPGYRIDIVRPDGSTCDPEEVGEIIIRIDGGKPFGMFGGYYRDEERTQKVFEGGVYHTGDTAWKDKDGYCWFIGRTDDLIKSSGYRISPFEVEEVLLKHPAVLECAVTGVEDPSRGRPSRRRSSCRKATRRPRNSRRTSSCSRRRSPLPTRARIIDFVLELPKTISGKIRRVAIREKDKQEQQKRDSEKAK